MTKPVSGQTVFGSNTTGTTTQLDNNFLLAYNALNDLNTYGNFLTDLGGADAIAVTLAAGLTGILTNGLVLQIKVAGTNTGATTLNYNLGGVLNVLNTDGTALSAGQLVLGGIYQFQYRASDTSWLLQTPTLIGASSAMVLIANKQANANTSIVFTSGIGATYDQYMVTFKDVLVACANVNLLCKISVDGGGNYISGGGYRYGLIGTTEAGTSGGIGSATSANIILAQSASNANTGGISGEVRFTAGTQFRTNWQVSHIRGSDLAFLNWNGSGMEGNANANAVQIIASSGNITSGNIALYGIKKS